MVTKSIRLEAGRLAEQTSEAFSYGRYGYRNWKSCITWLLEHQYTTEEIKHIMFSKWTRWAADHGTPTRKSFVEFMEGITPEDVRQLVSE